MGYPKCARSRNLVSEQTWSITVSSYKTWELKTPIEAPRFVEDTIISGAKKTCVYDPNGNFASRYSS